VLLYHLPALFLRSFSVHRSLYLQSTDSAYVMCSSPAAKHILELDCPMKPSGGRQRADGHNISMATWPPLWSNECQAFTLSAQNQHIMAQPALRSPATGFVSISLRRNSQRSGALAGETALCRSFSLVPVEAGEMKQQRPHARRVSQRRMLLLNHPRCEGTRSERAERHRLVHAAALGILLIMSTSHSRQVLKEHQHPQSQLGVDPL